MTAMFKVEKAEAPEADDLEVIWQQMATNKRTGIALVGPKGATLPWKGGVKPLGRSEGVLTFQLLPLKEGQEGTWVMAFEAEARIHGGAVVVAEENLQSNTTATILLLGPCAVVEVYGYKRRSSRVVAYQQGNEQDVPVPILMAMGIIEGKGPREEIASPPALQGAMAAAFAKLRQAT